ncbi:MAG TPA: COX15/CtaA family protein [Propionicimonas sp.]|jgi:cytochrome c oxidase assembly protein subunit 15|nr:COX15/CtaA family protein [Propionicimonas sp.]
MDLLTSPLALRRWAVASLVANMVIIVTGGLVRVTDSGLGCSTWPQCEPGSYLPHPEAGLHAFIEFGNRLLTFVLVAVALGAFLSAWRARTADGAPLRRARWLTFGIGLGIIAQAVIGGISVRTQLNPWVVGLHLIPSIGLVGACVVLVHEAYGLRRTPVTPRVRRLVWLALGLGLAVMVVGAIVTGSGPLAGDGAVHRNGLDPTATARVHSLGVWALVGITIALVVWTNGRARRAALLLLATELLQGAIGYAQYALSLPPALVTAHMAGTTLFTAALTHLWWSTRDASTAGAGEPATTLRQAQGS